MVVSWEGEAESRLAVGPWQLKCLHSEIGLADSRQKVPHTSSSIQPSLPASEPQSSPRRKTFSRSLQKARAQCRPRPHVCLGARRRAVKASVQALCDAKVGKANSDSHRKLLAKIGAEIESSVGLSNTPESEASDCDLEPCLCCFSAADQSSRRECGRRELGTSAPSSPQHDWTLNQLTSPRLCLNHKTSPSSSTIKTLIDAVLDFYGHTIGAHSRIPNSSLPTSKLLMRAAPIHDLS